MPRSKAGSLRRKWLELRLLARPGIGLSAIAPQVCRLAREIVGAEAASLFWLDRNNMPLGFFHEDSPVEARDLFVNEFERLFVGPNELNVLALAQSTGAPCGLFLRPPAAYFRSNTHNLLVRPSGHHHALDLRIEDADGGRAVLLLFRGHHPPFTDQDAKALTLFEPLLRRAGSATTTSRWQSDPDVSGHLLIDPVTAQILAISDTADAMLRRSNLVGQGLALYGPLDTAPQFLMDLCKPTLKIGRATAALAVPAGRLHIEATVIRQTNSWDKPGGAQILATLRHETPAGIALIGPILARQLSPLRSEILLYAASGGTRETVPRAFSISKESAKKHLSEIYRAVEIGRWEEISAALAATAGAHAAQ